METEMTTKQGEETFCEVVASDSDIVNECDTVYVDPYVGIKHCETDYALYVLADEEDILSVVNECNTVYADPYVGIKPCEKDDALYVLVDEEDILAVVNK